MTGANKSEINQPLWKLRNPARGQRSGQSRVPSFLRFVNRTTRRVNVTWIDYDGRSTHYKTLSAGCCVDVNTFVGHPWTFQDRDSGDTLVVQSQAVYLPEAWNRDKDGWPPRRRLVFISLPGKYPANKLAHVILVHNWYRSTSMCFHMYIHVFCLLSHESYWVRTAMVSLARHHVKNL